MERAITSLKTFSGKEEMALIKYNLSLVQKYSEGGLLDQAIQLSERESVVGVFSLQTKVVVAVQREKWTVAADVLHKLAGIEDLPPSQASAFRHAYGIALNRAQGGIKNTSKCNELFDSVEVRN